MSTLKPISAAGPGTQIGRTAAEGEVTQGVSIELTGDARIPRQFLALRSERRAFHWRRPGFG